MIYELCVGILIAFFGILGFECLVFAWQILFKYENYMFLAKETFGSNYKPSWRDFKGYFVIGFIVILMFFYMIFGFSEGYND